MASSSNVNTGSPGEKYTYPTEFFLLNYIVPKLSSPDKYENWKLRMLDFIHSQGLIGFIHGTVAADESNQHDHMAWKRSDNLVSGWILATLNQETRLQMLDMKKQTARGLWSELEKRFVATRPSLSTVDPGPKIADMEVQDNRSVYLELNKAAVDGDWDKAKGIVENHPNALRSSIDQYGHKLLHAAVTSGSTAATVRARKNRFMKELLEKADVVDVVDDLGLTALHYAAAANDVEGAKMLVHKNKDLPRVSDKKQIIPLHWAAYRGHREMVLYLTEVTGTNFILEKDQVAALLLNNLTQGELYDMALELLRKKPKLAVMEQKPNPLDVLAGKHSSFRSGSSRELNFWRFVLPRKSEDNDSNLPRGGRGDVENSAAANSCISAGQRLHFMMWEVAEKLENVNIIKYAIMDRHERVFNLIYQIDGGWRWLYGWDDSWNNSLHLAACLRPKEEINLKASATGPVLQMQRELRWYEAVKNLSPPSDKEGRNKDGMTPGEVFTKTHQDLVNKAEKWMKETTTSCTIVAALIATVVFTASITLPGGNDDLGQPLLLKRKAFQIFGISNALALFSSITSVLMFLLILTSRYREQDFLHTLPSRLIIGLVTLFVSILSTMVAFGATLYLMFGDNKAWILIPAVALASVPVILFGALQFPLLVEMIRATYGKSIFGRQSDRMIY